MPPKARAGVKRHVAERLGLGRFDHFPDVDPHRSIDDLQLVDQGDIHTSEDVF